MQLQSGTKQLAKLRLHRSSEAQYTVRLLNYKKITELEQDWGPKGVYYV